MKSEYTTYKEWKGWGVKNVLSPWMAKYFESEISRATTKEPTTFLEVGFGNGEFLEWAKTRGASVTGIEIIPELVQAADVQGYEVFQWSIASGDDKNPLKNRKFDCIVALDVIEHLSTDEIRVCFFHFGELLQDGGRIVLRFPNGESPFSLPFQNGDHTHRTWLTKVKLEHLCLGSGLELEAYRNSFRIANHSRFYWIKSLLFIMRDAVEIFIGYVYYSKRVPLDANAVAVLRKKKSI